MVQKGRTIQRQQRLRLRKRQNHARLKSGRLDRRQALQECRSRQPEHSNLAACQSVDPGEVGVDRR